MPYIISDHNKANLGWLYYKNYFEDTVLKDDRRDHFNEGKVTLENRNFTITQRRLESQPHHFEVRARHSLRLVTTYPGLLTGSGYTHEYGKDKKDKDDALKIGFFFDHVTGMPCLPGHSVKGALRSAFPNHKGEKYKIEKSEALVAYFDEKSISARERYFDYLSSKKIRDAHYSPQLFATLLGELIFEGKEPYRYERGEFLFTPVSLYNRDIFHDAYICSGGKDEMILANDYITPHDNPLKDPKPIQFLKVLPEVSFQFQFDLKDNLITGAEKAQLFEHLLLTFGIGAKTNVGYGQFMTIGEKVRLQMHRGTEKEITVSPIIPKNTITNVPVSNQPPADAANYLKTSNKNIVAQIEEITSDKVILKVQNLKGKYDYLEKKIKKLKEELKIDDSNVIDPAWEFRIIMQKDYSYGTPVNFKVSFLK